MCNPNFALKYSDELIEILKHPKMFKFLHLPVQSGNDEILKKMKRKYTSQEFKDLVRKLRKEIPMLTIATDFIVGFPTETYSQFMDSVLLMKSVKLDVLNLSKFWPRPRTAALRTFANMMVSSFERNLMNYNFDVILI